MEAMSANTTAATERIETTEDVIDVEITDFRFKMLNHMPLKTFVNNREFLKYCINGI